MICPQCDGEYREGYTVCTVCEVPLTPLPESYEIIERVYDRSVRSRYVLPHGSQYHHTEL